MVRVIFLSVTSEPELRDVEDDLKTLQGLVGGYIENIKVTGFLSLWVHEDGRRTVHGVNEMARLVATIAKGFAAPIYGPAIVVRSDKDGKLVDVTDEDVQYLGLERLLPTGTTLDSTGKGIRIVIREGLNVCDFCGSKEHVNSTLPATSFLDPNLRGKPVDVETSGNWACCDTCLPIVQARDAHRLAVHVDKALQRLPDQPKRSPGFPSVGNLRRLYRLFFQHWDGRVLPYTATETGMGL